MHTDVAALLIDIEAELRQMGCWDEEPPSAEALASEQPFAVDTLSLPQWLQFIFLPTMYSLIEHQATLPQKCGIAPMAEEHFRGRPQSGAALIEALESMDELLSGVSPDYSVHPDGEPES